MFVVTIVVKEEPDGNEEALIMVSGSDNGADAYIVTDLTKVPAEISRLLAYNMLIEGNVH